jgi:hypothetical protein
MVDDALHLLHELNNSLCCDANLLAPVRIFLVGISAGSNIVQKLLTSAPAQVYMSSALDEVGQQGTAAAVSIFLCRN